MRCLVTGGAGFIGAALSNALVRSGHEVRVLDNLSSGREENVPSGADFVIGDLLDRDVLLELCAGVDTIFHQAAVRSVPRSVSNPLASHDANATGTINVLEAGRAAGVKRLIYASSSSVYGELTQGRNIETTRPNPRSPYAASKLAGENYCAVWAQLGWVETVSLRYFNVFGPGQSTESKYSALFPAFIQALSQGQAPIVHWDGLQTRDFTFIDDVVEANLLAAVAPQAAVGRSFNIGSGSPRSVIEVLRRVAEAVGIWKDPQMEEKRSGDVRSTFADVTAASELLGWRPHMEWGEAVEETVAWFLSQNY